MGVPFFPFSHGQARNLERSLIDKIVVVRGKGIQDKVVDTLDAAGLLNRNGGRIVERVEASVFDVPWEKIDESVLDIATGLQ